MTHHEKSEMALSPYRVLDLAQGGCCLAGKYFGDLGADVIKVEPPGGDPTRNIGPFYHDIPHPEKSLFWFSYNNNKRSITLDIETEDGAGLFEQLVKISDFVIESFPAGYMDSLGLGYNDLSTINPSIIMASITPFGQTGPKSHYKGSDLTGWASGGVLYTMGDPDRPPINLTFTPQATLHAAAEATAGALIAHYHRAQTGEGQLVDVSLQDTCIWVLQAVAEMYDMNKYIYKRAGAQWVTGSGVGRRQCFQVKDGYIAFTIIGGGLVGAVKATRAMVQWMKEDGMAPDWLVDYDWEHNFDTVHLTQEEVDRVEAPFIEWLKTKTKDELWSQAIGRGLLIAPLTDMKDLAEDEHLKERNYWAELEHPELNDVLTYPVNLATMSETPGRLLRRAPLIGEHNEEVYLKDLGIPKEKFIMLKEIGVI